MQYLSCLLLAICNFAWVANPAVSETRSTLARQGRAIPLQLKTLQREEQQEEKKEQEEPKAEEGEVGKDARQDEAAANEGPVIDVPEPKVDQKRLRFHLWDGTIITGQMATDKITVATEYGALDFPVEKVMEIDPGLNSYPQIQNKLDRLVKELGDSDYKTRKAAHRELSRMGLQIKNELQHYGDGGNAERKKHLDELKSELAKLEEDAVDFEDELEKPFIRGDSLTTPEFTIVGDIEQSQFLVDSKYGQLTVRLEDIKRVDRPVLGGEEVRRTVVVNGQNLMQLDMKSVGIRVNRGDKISISAEGSIQMTPWGGRQVCTPDGSPQFGWYIDNQIPSGALVGKIGDSGDAIKIGSRKRFVAERSGLLKLGIAMQHNYARGNYQFPGNYKVNINVTPGK